MSLAATDVGLAAIRSHCEKSDDDNALRVQEQELLVVSKECFYVLAHVCEALGKHIEVCHCALYRIVGLFPRFNSLPKPHLLHNPCKSIYVLQGHKCLDRIEVYVDEQKARDKSLYNQAMEKVPASGSVTDVGLVGM